VSKKLSFPIRIYEEGVRTELVNITEEPIDQAIFDIPRYYKNANTPYAPVYSRRRVAESIVKHEIMKCIGGYQFEGERNLFDCEFEGQEYSVGKSVKKGGYSLSFLKDNEPVNSITLRSDGYEIECKFVNDEPKCEVR
jgi:hypothetical protein